MANGVTGAFTQDELDELLQKEMEAMDSSNDSNKNKKKISNSKKGNENNRSGRPSVAKYYLKGLGRKAILRVANANPAKAVARTVGGVTLGAVAGGIGLAAGIASGDLSKTAQYAGGAALGGYKLGSGGVSQSVSSLDKALHVDGIKEIRERAKYKNEQEYKDAQQQKYVKRYQKDINNQFKLEQKYEKKEAKRIMKDVVPECLDKGITNMDDIITINELVNSGFVDSLDMGIATAKYASMMGDVTKMKAKDQKEWHKTLYEGFDKNKKLKANNMDADTEATNAMDRIRMFYKIKSDL